MISSLYLQNFKGFAKAHIPLERLTVIVGPNASGKTSILQALEYLSFASTKSPNEFFHDRRAPELLCREAREPLELVLLASTDTISIRLRIQPHFANTSGASGQQAGDFGLPTFKGWILHREVCNENGNSDQIWEKLVQFPPAFRSLGPSEILRLDISQLATPTNGTQVMKSDGHGLASDLATMALGQPESYQRIQSNLKSVDPLVEQFRIVRSVWGGNQLRESVVFDFVAAKGIPADLASEGTLLVLGLLTALTSSLRPNLILLDDIDRGLHPKAQKEVIGLLRAILDQNPELQIVATTRSPCN